MKQVIYKGYLITKIVGLYGALGVMFKTLALAKKEIDKLEG